MFSSHEEGVEESQRRVDELQSVEKHVDGWKSIGDKSAPTLTVKVSNLNP